MFYHTFNVVRFILRVLRALPVTRRKLNPVVLRTVLKTFFTADADKVKQQIEKFSPSHLIFEYSGDEGVPAVLGAERHPGAGREPDPVPRQGELHAALPRGGLLHLPAHPHSSD